MLALVTGTGALPSVVAARQETRPVICALEGHKPDGLEVDQWFRLETIGTLVHRLVKQGVTDVCFCGAIQRPGFNPMKLDVRTMPLVPTLAKAVRDGEDAALRAILGLFEKSGIVVHGAHVLAPDLLPPQGVLTRTKVIEGTEAQLIAAEQVSVEQGRADEGQSCVVRDEQVIAREDASGTDTMLRGLLSAGVPGAYGARSGVVVNSAGDVLDEAADVLTTAVTKSGGGIFFKAPKPHQDHRVDLPTVGPETARAVIAAGLDGMVIASGGVMVLERDKVVRLLDEAGVFLWVR